MISMAISASAIWGKVWPILLAILFFGLLIFLHELGHFTFAKFFGVKVNEFSMGMGPVLLKKKKKETQYSIRLFPIGGFVSMEGESENSEDERAFCNQKAWKRFIIIAAGGVVNLIMGIIILTVMLSLKTNADGSEKLIGTREIHSFYTEDAASRKYLKEGDELLKIDGKNVFSGDDINFLMQRNQTGCFDFVVLRDGKKVELKNVQFKTSKYEFQGKERNSIVMEFYIVGVPVSFRSVVTNIIPETLTYSRLVYLSLFDLITGTYGMSDLSGPIGTVSYIADAAAESKKNMDWSYLCMLTGMIAINIGLFNLLPLPALDGGHLFFILIEIIFRKPVPKKLEALVHAIGMVLLLALMAVISFSDILKLVKG